MRVQGWTGMFMRLSWSLTACGAAHANVPLHTLAEWQDGFGLFATLLQDCNGGGRDDLAIVGKSRFSEGTLWVIASEDRSIIDTIQTSFSEKRGALVQLVGSCDLDGDGSGDLITAWSVADERTGTEGKRRRIHRVLSGSKLEVSLLERVCETLAVGPDIDGDGLLDCVIEERAPAPDGRSLISLVSSGTGETVWEFASGSFPVGSVEFRWMNDLDGDGIADLFVAIDSRHLADSLHYDGLHMRLVSGKKGSMLRSVSSDWNTRGCKTSLVTVSGRDGTRDLLWGILDLSSDSATYERDLQCTRLLSGSSLELIGGWKENELGSPGVGVKASEWDLIGHDLLGSVTDECPWWALVSAPGSGGGTGGVYVITPDHKVSFLPGPRAAAGYGSTLSGGGDWNGDGVEDWVVACGRINDLPRKGMVDVRSGVDSSLLRRIRLAHLVE